MDPSEHNCYDYAHTVLMGSFPVQADLMMHELRSSSIGYEHLHQYVQSWRWPRRLEGRSATGKDAMNAKRAESSKKAGTFKCSASEALSLCTVMAHWLRRVVEPTGRHNLAVQAFLLLVRVMEMLVASARGVVTPEALALAITRYLIAFSRAHDIDDMIPKFHYMLHFARILKKFGWLPNCTALERKHKTPKRYAGANNNTSKGYDSSVLREVTCKSLHDLEHGEHLDLQPGLISPRPAKGRMLAWLKSALGPNNEYKCSRDARHSAFEQSSQGDIVAIRSVDGASWSVGEVWFHASCDDVCFSAISVFELVAMSRTYSEWRDVDHPEVVAPEDIMDVLIHSMCGNECTVLHTYSLQGKG